MSVSIYNIPLDIISLMSEYMDKRIWFLNTCTRFRAIFLKLYSTKHGREQLFGDNRTVVRLADQASIIVYDPTGQKIWCHICKVYIKKDKYQAHVLKQKMHKHEYVCVCLDDEHSHSCVLNYTEKCSLCFHSIKKYRNTISHLLCKSSRHARRNPFFKCMHCKRGLLYGAKPKGCLGCMTFYNGCTSCSKCYIRYSCRGVHLCC